MNQLTEQVMPSRVPKPIDWVCAMNNATTSQREPTSECIDAIVGTHISSQHIHLSSWFLLVFTPINPEEKLPFERAEIYCIVETTTILQQHY